MSSTSPKTLLNRLGLRPKKTLGQHFLLHPHQARRIVAALHLTGEETVVEIGAGLGALTVFLAPAARRVIALERDPDLARFLREDLLVDDIADESQTIRRDLLTPLVRACPSRS